jgi:hypothetical protein
MGAFELQPLRGMEVAADGTRQRRRVIAGEGMVQPKIRTSWRTRTTDCSPFSPAGIV